MHRNGWRTLCVTMMHAITCVHHTESVIRSVRNSQIQNRMSENPTTMERNAMRSGRLYGGYIVCASSLRSFFQRARACVYVYVWWRGDVQTLMLARILQHRDLNVFRQKIESKSFFVASSTYYNRCCWALMFASCLVLAVFFLLLTFAVRRCVVFVIVVNAHTVSTLTHTCNRIHANWVVSWLKFIIIMIVSRSYCYYRCCCELETIKTWLYMNDNERERERRTLTHSHFDQHWKGNVSFSCVFSSLFMFLFQYIFLLWTWSTLTPLALSLSLSRTALCSCNKIVHLIIIDCIFRFFHANVFREG